MKIKAKSIKTSIEGIGDIEVLRLGYKANLKVVEENDDRWIIEGYASVFGNVDSYYEIVDKGAFTEFLAKYPKDAKTGVPRFPKLVFGHDWMEPLGPTLEAREDEIGLYVKGELLKDVKRAQEVYALIKSGAMTDLSFGFRVLEDEFDHETGYRHLKKIDIFEWSPVLVGANPKATLTGVKSLDGHDIPEIPAKAVVKFLHVKDDGSEMEEEETPVTPDPVEETPGVAEDEGSQTDVDTPAEDAPAPEEDPKTAKPDEEKAGRTLSKKTRKAIESSVGAMTSAIEALGKAGDALDALLSASDEDESTNSDTVVEKKRDNKGTTHAVKLLLRDAQRADQMTEKVIVRAKTILLND